MPPAPPASAPCSASKTSTPRSSPTAASKPSTRTSPGSASTTTSTPSPAAPPRPTASPNATTSTPPCSAPSTPARSSTPATAPAARSATPPAPPTPATKAPSTPAPASPPPPRPRRPRRPPRHDRAPALRLDVTAALARLRADHLAYDDRLAGPQRFDLIATMGDFVVRRVDGIAAYQLACAWDDAAMGCTQIVRGADLIPSTARQLLILRVLGLPEPTYAHLGLVVDHRGQRLAKRDRAISLRALRAAGVPADAVIRLLARVSGLPDTADPTALLRAFDLTRLDPGEVRLPEDPLGLG
ncbi:MAG: glutamate--tRNA ligase family protein [bacterium]